MAKQRRTYGMNGKKNNKNKNKFVEELEHPINSLLARLPLSVGYFWHLVGLYCRANMISFGAFYASCCFFAAAASFIHCVASCASFATTEKMYMLFV